MLSILQDQLEKKNINYTKLTGATISTASVILYLKSFRFYRLYKYLVAIAVSSFVILVRQMYF
jgi:hypothetical protein